MRARHGIWILIPLLAAAGAEPEMAPAAASGWLRPQAGERKEGTPWAPRSLGPRRALNQPGPLLSLDTGGHAGVVRQVLFTPDGTRLVSVGDDKVIRVWDPAGGDLLRTIRGPSGPGPAGALFAAALAPDGYTLAVAGIGMPGTPEHWGDIRFFDLRTGKLTRLVNVHRDAVTALAFSPDGKLLASAGADGSAAVTSAADGQVVRRWRDRDGTLTAAAWSPDGRRLAAANEHGDVVVWTQDGEEPLRISAHDGEATCVAWSADGKLLASGGLDKRVRLWDAQTGRARLDPPALRDGVSAVVFTPDGGRLLVGLGGLAGMPGGLGALELPAGREVRTLRDEAGPVSTLAVDPHGRLAACGDAEGRIMVWSLDGGKRLKVLQGRGENVWAVAWSPDSRRVAWGYRPPGREAKLQRSFDLDHGAPGADPREGETWQTASPKTPGLSLEQPAAGDRVVLRLERRPQVTIKADPELEGRVLSVCDLGTELVAVGTEYTLAIHDLTGRRVAVLAGHSGPVVALAKSPDGRLLASASLDQTVRLWPLSGLRTTPRGRPGGARGGREQQSSAALPQVARPLLSLFMGRDREWVAWSSGGFYACSPGGEEVVGWQVNHGPDQAADYVTAYELRRKLYRPDIIAKLGRAGSLAEVMLALPSGTGHGPAVTVDEANVAGVAPPRVEILAPLDGASLDAGDIEVRARAVDPNGRAVTSTTLRINGRPARFVFVPARGEPGEWSSKVSLPPGANTLTAVAVNDDGAEGVSPPCRVTCLAAGGAVSKPALYVLSVGVSTYRSAGLTLQFAAKDARDLAAGWQTQAGKLYDKVETKVLTDQAATRVGVLGGLTWLAAATRQQDYAVLFVAGHGVSDADGTYYFLTHEADLHALPTTALKWSELRDGLDQVRGRVLLLLDTCHAGAATGPPSYDQGYNDMLRDARQEQVGLITFASCLPQQSSLESAQWGNGAFTKAVVEGLQGGPQEMLYDGKLTISALEAYVSARVEELTGGRQSPSLNKPTSVPSSLPLAVLQ